MTHAWEMQPEPWSAEAANQSHASALWDCKGLTSTCTEMATALHAFSRLALQLSQRVLLELGRAPCTAAVCRAHGWCKQHHMCREGIFALAVGALTHDSHTLPAALPAHPQPAAPTCAQQQPGRGMGPNRQPCKPPARSSHSLPR